MDDFTDMKTLLEYTKKNMYISHDKDKSTLETNLINEAIAFGYIVLSANRSYMLGEKGYLFLDDLINDKTDTIIEAPTIKPIIKLIPKSVLENSVAIITIASGIVAVITFIKTCS